MIALVDCNNFFVSCQRVFNPKLKDKPVLVLSGNDGCVIARSNEVKKIGIKMGQPFHEIKSLVNKHQINVFSSNFTLYGAMSNRVMQIIASEINDYEIYSVDEAFLNLNSYDNPEAVCRKLREKILKWSGIPISVGIASTKTLAKVAVDVAKKSTDGVFMLHEQQRREILGTLPVESIWGIGRQWSKHLRMKGINSALDLIEKSDDWIRKSLKVVGLRTATELRGVPCYTIDVASSPKKGITVSRSFGRRLKTLEEIEEAIATFTTSACAKMRREKRLTRYIIPFIKTSPFDKTQTYYKNSILMGLDAPTNFTPDIIKAAKEGLRQIFRGGLHYKKCGVHLVDLIDDQAYTQDLFAPALSDKQQKLMKLVDKVNSVYGKSALKFAASAGKEKFKSNSSLKSKSFTSWEGMLKVKV